MSDILYLLFVIVVNIIGWGMLIAGVLGFIYVAYRLIFHPGENGSLPWL